MKHPKAITLLLCAALLFGCIAGLTGCGGVSSEGYRIPIVCGETGMNDLCGVATYGVNYYNLGVKAGDMAADILLDGADVSTLPVQLDLEPALSVNTKVAEAIGFTIPDAVLAGAGGGGSLSVERADSAIVEKDGDFTVGILQLVQHIALDQANKGFQDQLSVRMSAAGKTVTILDRNASNDQSNNITIADQLVSQGVDLIYAIATSSSQAAASATAESGIPVLFCAVTNPVGEGLVQSMELPGGNVSGVSDLNPVARQIGLLGELFGRTDIKVGLLYTSAETNSVYQIGLAIEACRENGFSYVEKGISDINDIQAAFMSLSAEGVDAIYIPTDNTLANACATLYAINTGE